MIETGSDASVERVKVNLARRRVAVDDAVRAILAITVALVAVGPAHAKGKWSLQLEPMFMDAYGHDQHVLTIHQLDLDSTPQTDDKTAVNLDTEAGTAYRFELQYNRGPWGWGFDFFWFNTGQGRPSRSAAASAPNNPVIFEVADRQFTSSDPSETLFYNVLEDTDLAVWTADLYALRTLAEKPDSSIRLQFGLRIGDFDNDYRAVVGIQDVAGRRLDASSNYGQMFGPLVGLAGDVRRGKNTIRGYLGQSLLIGDPELAGMSREFTGPFVEEAAFFTQESFFTQKDVAIPITDFRIKWTYGISRWIALGIGANTSVWWDVSVPPGVIPIADGDEALHENTIVFFGVTGAVHLTF